MVTKTVNQTVNQQVAERNIRLTGEFTHYILANPHLLEALPEKFELVILPEGDPELQNYSLQLLNQRQIPVDQPVVFVWMRSTQNGVVNHLPSFQFYVPADKLMAVANGL